MCELYMQKHFGANAVLGMNTVFGANTLPPQIYHGFLPQKMCELFPQICIGYFICTCDFHCKFACSVSTTT